MRSRASLAFAAVGLVVLGLSVNGATRSLPTIPSGGTPLYVDDHAKDPVEPGVLQLPLPPIV